MPYKRNIDNVAMAMLDDVYDGSTIQARVLAAAQENVRQTLSSGADAGGGAAGGAVGEGGAASLGTASAASSDGPDGSTTTGGGKPLLAALAALAALVALARVIAGNRGDGLRTGSCHIHVGFRDFLIINQQ